MLMQANLDLVLVDGFPVVAVVLVLMRLYLMLSWVPVVEDQIEILIQLVISYLMVVVVMDNLEELQQHSNQLVVLQPVVAVAVEEHLTMLVPVVVE